MKSRPHSNSTRIVALGAIVGVLTACASAPVPNIRREAPLAIEQATKDIEPGQVAPDATTTQSPAPSQVPDGPRPQIHRGTGEVINLDAAATPPPGLRSTTGSASFNFEGESLHAVLKAILGDMLGQNYVVAPGVQGTVSLNTPKPVSPAEAFNLLEMVLGWNNAQLVYSGGRYNVVPSDKALAGNVAPRTGPVSTARGFEVRAVPLRYVSAGEMEKILKPYARPNAIVSIDGSRNLITIGGSRTELENYLRTIEIFDVDWLAGMSVGVFPLRSGKASQVVSDLEKIFGEQSKSPVAGMFRFMPLDGANAVLVITPQASYLDDIQQWLDRIDSAGDSVQLYSHELKYIKAKDLADQLSQVFGAGRGAGSASSGPPSLMPGLNSVELKDTDTGSSATIGGSGGTSMSIGPRQNGNASLTLQVDGSPVGVSAIEETNSLIVRSSASAWKSIRDVIDRLDVMPMQVHIEAQVAQVELNGALSYGVSWYFERGVTDAGLPSAVGRDTWSTLAGSVQSESGSPAGLAWTFLGRNAAAVISALDRATDVQLLQTPSVMVRNNTEATLNVGSRIPISSVTVSPGTGGDNTISQVQYLDTGTILKVRPRAAKDGMVFLDVVQEISAPVGTPDRNGNVAINTRRLKTEVAVQSGDTVMLAGLISDEASRGSSGFPGLNRIPIIGGLFGVQSRSKSRSETIILLTPKIVRNPQEVRDLTDEYGRRFRAMAPLQHKTSQHVE